jgi:hypothetical protein
MFVLFCLCWGKALAEMRWIMKLANVTVVYEFFTLQTVLHVDDNYKDNESEIAYNAVETILEALQAPENVIEWAQETIQDVQIDVLFN